MPLGDFYASEDIFAHAYVIMRAAKINMKSKLDDRWANIWATESHKILPSPASKSKKCNFAYLGVPLSLKAG